MDRRTFLSHSGQLFVAAGLAPSMFAENRMPEPNQRRSLSFSNDWIESVLVSAVREMPVEDAIVVNLSTTPLLYRAGGDRGTILPWKSAMLRHCTLESGEAAALLHVVSAPISVASRWAGSGSAIAFQSFLAALLSTSHRRTTSERSSSTP